MKSITVSKTDLVAKLTTNRATHTDEFTSAIGGWHQSVLDALREASLEFDETEDLKNLNIAYRFPKPECHDDEYDRALQMLEWEVGDSVTLTEEDFRHFVQDDWDWTSRHRAFSSQYSSS